jgi:putative oxidoreductase
MGETMQRFMSALAAQNGIAFLLLRLMTAHILIVAGYRKFFVLGIEGTIKNFEGYGIPFHQVAGPAIGALELVGGILLAIGLFTRYLGVLFTLEFIVAWWVKYAIIPAPAGGYAGSRLDMLILVVALVFATQGAGALSLDAKQGRA